jgi:type II secretory pathway pseudopilin PulG
MSFPHPSRPGRTRDGFTAIEMMVVISVMILLVAMSLPGLFPALKKGRVSDAAEAIMRVASQARQMARLRPQPVGAAVSYYGVSVVVPATGPAYAVLTYGNNPPGAAANEFYNDLNGNGTADPNEYVCKVNFNNGVRPFNGSTGAPPAVVYTLMGPGSSVAWFYQYRTGFPIKSTDPADVYTPINVGVSGSPAPLPSLFGVCSLDQKFVSAIAVYRIGLCNAHDQ